MANSITKFKAYIDLLDEVYKQDSLTSVLDMNGSLVRQGANANEIIIPKISMDGLGDYSRSTGYADGDVIMTNETVTFGYDRGRAFTMDSMDNAETAGQAFGAMSSRFLREHAIPELDAYRFATYAGMAGISTATSATLTTGQNVLSALLTAQNSMDENEVPESQRYLFITPSLLNSALNVDTTKSKAVLDAFANIIKVPQPRFYTAITLNDGSSSGETTGGYSKDPTTGKNINFMIIHKPAVIQFSKHVVNKVITPEENQTSDGWKFFYRSYGIADAYENKLKGIYLHKAS